jgi:CHAT domain-containing protein
MVVGRYQLRVQNLRAATPEDQSRTIAEQSANWLLIEGRQLAEKKAPEEMRQAVAKYQAALPLWQLIGDQRGRAATLTRLGVVHDNLREWSKALEYYQQALPLWQAAGDRLMEGATLSAIGMDYAIMLQFQTGLSYLERALPLVRVGDDRALEAATFTSICATSLFSDQQKALECLDQARALWQASEEPYGEAQALSLTSVAYRLLGEKELADQYQAQSDRKLQAGAAPSGELSPREKDRLAAGQALSQAALLAAQGTATCRQAIVKYEGALKLWRDVPDRVVEAAILAAIGSCWFSLDEKQKSLDYFNQALMIWRELENQHGEALVLSFISEVYDSMDESKQAREHLDQALRLWRGMGDQLEADLLYLDARIERSYGRLAEAQKQIESALNVIETLRARLFAPERRTSLLSSKHAYYEFYIDLLMERHRQAPAAGYHRAAIEVSERARARSLLDLLAEARADIRQGADPELLKRERSLQRQIYAKERHRLEKLRGTHTLEQLKENLPATHTPEQLKAVNQEIAMLLQQYQDLGAQMRRSSPRYVELTRPQPLGLPEIQQQVLDEETLLLEYALGERRSYLWAVTPSSITSFELPKRAEIEAAARQVYELLTERGQCKNKETARQKEVRIAKADAQYVEAAARLSRMLLSPVAAQLGGKRLLIVADGALQYVPFAALPRPESGGAEKRDDERKKAGNPQPAIRNPQSFTPLIVDHEIISTPSASTMAVLRRELAGRNAAPKTLAVLADPAYSLEDGRVSGRPSTNIRRRALSCNANAKPGEWSRLIYSRIEADRITSFLPPEQTLKAVGFQASRKMAMSDELSQYRIVHFSIHSKADSERPELSTLVLSLLDESGKQTEGYLRAHEIYNLKLPAELVVLSACETGLGKNVRGEGLISMTRGFMYAGAKRVVVSLWSVNDAPTADLMVMFYRAMLKDGLPAPAALRQAQIEMWKSKRLSAPFFWAGFVLQGEWK